MYLPSDDTGTAEIQESPLRNTKFETSANNQQNSKEKNENRSSGSQTQPQGKGKSKQKSMALESDSKLKSSEDTIWKEKGKATESFKATNSQLNNFNILTAEVKNMHDLEEARLALTRLKHVMKTVTHANSASQTVDMAEDKVPQTEDGAKTTTEKTSPVESTSTVQEKESKIRKGNAGRRGERGLKMLKRDAGLNTPSKEGGSRTVVVDDAKLAKQKGESISISKNAPGLKFESLPSKNTRDNPLAELLFAQPKGSLPVGPKHTPPLKDKEPLAHVRNCENLGRKKRKGEAFTAECLTQDPNKQVQSSSAERVTSIEQTLSTIGFTKAEINERSTTKSNVLPDSDGEAVLMKQTSADKISAAASTDSLASERTAEATVHELSEKTTGKDTKVGGGSSTSGKNNLEVNSAENVSVESKTSDVEIEDTKQHDQATTGANDKRDAKVSGNNERKPTPVEDVTKSKTGDKEVDNVNETGRTATSGIVKNPKNSNRGQDKRQIRSSSSAKKELPTVGDKSNMVHDATTASINIKEQVKNAQFLHSVGAGSSVFETSFMNVHTDGSLQDLSEEECRHIEGIQALIVRNKQFSAWLSLDTKNVE